MLPSTFVEKAGFPERWQEKHLQEYLAERLRQRGFRVETEVRANGGRSDIVTTWQGGTIIEVKKYLDRDTIYQAFGQLNLYGLNNTHKLVVMGFLVVDADAQKSAFTTASMIEQDPRVKVVFVNLEEEWLPGNRVAVGWFRLPNFSFSFPTIPKLDWYWWFTFFKANPLILVLIAAIALAVAPELQQHQTPHPKPKHHEQRTNSSYPRKGLQRPSNN